MVRAASAREVVGRAAALALQPEPESTVSEWAAENRVLTTRSSDEEGPWRNERTPYLVEIMDALSPSDPCARVVFMKGSQIGGTEAGNNWLGFCIERAPGPFLFILPDLGLARRTSRHRIQPMLTETPRLADLVAPQKARDSSNTVLEKEFPGGLLVMVGANSGAGLRSTPCRYIFGDEIDAWPVEIPGEGAPLELAERGTRTYAANSKTLLVSTPTSEGASAISSEFADSDQSYFYVACPECEHAQRLLWSGIKYETEQDAAGRKIVVPGSVHYACAGCGVLIPERQKTALLAAGRWIATYPERSHKVRGFHLSSLYSPLGWQSWETCVELFLKAKSNPEKLRVWVNQTLGETWKAKGDTPDWEILYNRREQFPRGRVPAGGLVLTMGVDVQKDRLEAEVVAWGRDLENWSVDYIVLPGDPLEPKVWEELEALRARPWPAARGPDLLVNMLAVDTGYMAHDVYNWVRRRPWGEVMACKGRDLLPVMVSAPSKVDVAWNGKKLRRGVNLWHVGTNLSKSQLYGQLRQKQPTKPEETGYPRGWAHFPQYEEEYFKQLCAEQRVERIDPKTKRRVHKWDPVRERNEVLDCRILARAAACILGLDRLEAEEWNSLEKLVLGGGASSSQRTKARRRKPRTPYLKRKR